LDRGADPNLRTKDGSSALIVASNRGYTAIVSMLLKNDASLDAATDGSTATMCACIRGYKDIAFLLLDVDKNFDAANSKGWTPLMLAADKGCFQIINRLIKMGAKVDSRSTDAKWTALMSASANGFYDIAEVLIAGGADVNAQQAGGWNSLMIAAQAGHTSLVRLLLQHRAIVFDRKDQIIPESRTAKRSEVPDGAVPLIGATLGGHADIVSLLLEHGAKTETRTSSGKTPLMIAAARGDKAVLDVLLKHKAATPIMEDFGYTLGRIGWTRMRKLLGAGSGNQVEKEASIQSAVTVSKSQQKVD
jgi:uncharacterized protein